MVKIPFGAPFAGSENWDDCIVGPERECVDPKPSSWGQSKVCAIITVRLKKLVDSFQENFQMDGKICVITGATSGIGKETAFDLAQKVIGCVVQCGMAKKALAGQ